MNSLTPDTSELTFLLEGTVPGEIEAGSAVPLTDHTWTVTVPGSVLDAGIGLGLLEPGDTVPGVVAPAIFGANTIEGTKSPAPVAITLGPIGADPVTGLADDATTTFAIDGLSWTSVGGPVALSMDVTEVAVKIGVIDIAFTCTPSQSTAFVTSSAIGSTGQAPAVRPGPAPEVLGETTANATEAIAAEEANVPRQSSTQSLPVTGASALAPLLLALGLIDLGYLAHTASTPPRRARR